MNKNKWLFSGAVGVIAGVVVGITFASTLALPVLIPAVALAVVGGAGLGALRWEANKYLWSKFKRGNNQSVKHNFVEKNSIDREQNKKSKSKSNEKTKSALSLSQKTKRDRKYTSENTNVNMKKKNAFSKEVSIKKHTGSVPLCRSLHYDSVKFNRRDKMERQLRKQSERDIM